MGRRDYTKCFPTPKGALIPPFYEEGREQKLSLHVFRSKTCYMIISRSWIYGKFNIETNTGNLHKWYTI